MIIAGITFETEEDEEIEDIVKVSIIAQRMRNLPNKNKMRNRPKGENFVILKNIGKYNILNQNQSSLFSVRGFN